MFKYCLFFLVFVTCNLQAQTPQDSLQNASIYLYKTTIRQVRALEETAKIIHLKKPFNLFSTKVSYKDSLGNSYQESHFIRKQLHFRKTEYLFKQTDEQGHSFINKVTIVKSERKSIYYKIEWRSSKHQAAERLTLKWLGLGKDNFCVFSYIGRNRQRCRFGMDLL